MFTAYEYNLVKKYYWECALYMEQKNLKTSVFSLDTVFNESAEQPIDVDFTLPDYYPDISKILKCRAISRIASKGINGSNITVEGCVTITVIYCDSDSCLNSYEYQYPFSKTFDTGINTDGTALTVKTKCEYINCRAVTGRKIDIHGAAGIYVTMTRRKLTDIISDVDDPNIELLRGTIPATVPMGCADKYLVIDEEIELGSGQPDIRCIIRYDAAAAITDSKIIASKSVVKGEMVVKILYSPENGSPQTVRCTIPFSQLIEIDGMTDECSCESKVYIAHLEIKPRVSASGESRQFLLSAKLLVTSECCCNNDVAVILDAYSRKFEADISKNEVCFNKICENINETFNCKKNLEFSEGALSVISDMWCDTKTDSVKFSDNSIMICGTVTAYIIATGSDGIPAFYEKAIDFEYSHPINTDGKTFKCTPEITVLGSNYTLMGSGNMELRVDLNICASVYECSKIPLIVDIKINDSQPINKQKRGAMTVYFASAGENIWDIAHRYFADVEDIKQINEITENKLDSDCMILVPTN